jgi:hypothetical protein
MATHSRRRRRFFGHATAQSTWHQPEAASTPPPLLRTATALKHLATDRNCLDGAVMAIATVSVFWNPPNRVAPPINPLPELSLVIVTSLPSSLSLP